MDEITNILQEISERYSPMSPELIESLATHGKLYEVPAKTILIKEGQLADKAFFIIKGVAKEWYNKNGLNVVDWFAFEFEFMTAINSFFSANDASLYNIETIENCTLLELSKTDAFNLAFQYPDFQRLIGMITMQTMLALQARISSIQFRSAAERYQSLLKIRPDITQRVPLTDIASYLGITLETLSRIRKLK